jgi:hypothetical protein
MSRSAWNLAGRSRCDGASEENIGFSLGTGDLDHHPSEVRAVVPMERLRFEGRVAVWWKRDRAVSGVPYCLTGRFVLP